MKTVLGRLLPMILLVLTCTCTSRYRLNLYLVIDDVPNKVKVERTEYVQGAVIVDPYAEVKLMPGAGNCVILNLGRRGGEVEVDLYSLVGYDEYMRCLLYLQLPPELGVDTITLQANSFAQFMGRYDVRAEEKIFLPESGTLVVDSLAGKRLYGTISGNYTNNQGQGLGFDGRFRVRVAK